MRRRNPEAGLVVFWVKLMQRSYPQLCVKLADVLNEVKQVDPDTCLTRSMLIELMKQGVITPLKYGNAWVVNMDELLLFVNGKKEK